MDYLMVWVRTTGVFATLLLVTRILGKREMSELTFFDYVVGITIGSVGARTITTLKEPAGPMWAAIIILASYGFLVASVTMKSRVARRYVDGEPTVIVQNGKILENNMRKLRLTFQELMTGLRQKGVFDVGQLEFAILETDGKISVQKKSQFRPVTPRDLTISTQYEGRPIELIVDGEVLDENLQKVHLDRKWLLDQLSTQQITDPKSVAYAVLNSSGRLYVDSYDDKT